MNEISNKSTLMLYRWLNMSNKSKKKVIESYKSIEECDLKKTSILIKALNEYTVKNKEAIIKKALEIKSEK